MPKTFGDLKKAVLAFMGRKAGDLTFDSVEYVAQAVNSAKDFVQRGLDFEYSRLEAQVTAVSVTDGALLTAAVLKGTATPVIVKSVESVWLSNSAGSGQFPIKMASWDAYKERLARRSEHVTRIDDANSITDGSITPNTLTYVQLGRKFFIYPANQQALGGATFTVFLDIFEWIDDFTVDGTQHWIFDHCFDMLKFRSIVELNYFLKEDQRKVISDAHMEKLWLNVVNWNNTIISSQVDDASLN